MSLLAISRAAFILGEYEDEPEYQQLAAKLNDFVHNAKGTATFDSKLGEILDDLHAIAEAMLADQSYQDVVATLDVLHAVWGFRMAPHSISFDELPWGWRPGVALVEPKEKR